MTEHEYVKMIVPYDDVCQIMQNRLYALNHMMYGESHEKPIHSIHSRIKEKSSIENKLIRKEKETSVVDAKKWFMDIAGIRVICYFVDDVYNLVKVLKMQQDLRILEEVDYIKRPKDNGYRSYHIIAEAPIYYLNGVEYIPIEIQIRTLSMDLWACMEHRILYKKEDWLQDLKYKEKKMASYADQLMGMEKQMKKLNDSTKRASIFGHSKQKEKP